MRIRKTTLDENGTVPVHTADYVRILEELTADDKTVGIPVSGNSMSPFLITQRDYVVFKKPNRPLKRGDIVFFRRDSGEYILHRIFKITKDGYYIIGDAQLVTEGPIRRNQIFGLVIKVRRKGKWIDESDFWWRFFQYVWIRLIPFRPFIRKLYAIMAIPNFHRKIDE